MDSEAIKLGVRGRESAGTWNSLLQCDFLIVQISVIFLREEVHHHDAVHAAYMNNTLISADVG